MPSKSSNGCLGTILIYGRKKRPKSLYDVRSHPRNMFLRRNLHNAHFKSSSFIGCGIRT
ncbi:unnamed protein product [Cylicocyclus nassatus]|uniref:Uncharacterized protein n=1 Tax=Cylicocyclus nassatus TaxID=53992 RepID=A0AA36DP67_CYLNA|nr:unnamed protein product [Cylicocyclus nassatus]